MTKQTFFTDQFLIAMPSLQDPIFTRAVTYICEHSADGAMGIMINRPLDINLGEVFSQMDISSADPSINQRPIVAGGPIGLEQGFIIHEAGENFRSTLNTSNKLAVTTSSDILEAIAQGLGPKRSLISLGYAGWGAGQLEQEISDNYWINVPADLSIVFDSPFADRWNAAAALLGIDFTKLSKDVGHG